MTLSYRKFVNEVESRLSSRFTEDMHYSLQTVMKNNGSRKDALIIRKDGDDVSPTLYMNAFFEEYLKGMSIEEVVEGIMDAYENSRLVRGFNVSELMDYEAIKDRIIYRLINASMNEELLKDVPYIPYLDLAITFHLSVSVDDDISGTVLIHNGHIETWGVGVKELMKQATLNTQKLYPAEVKTIYEVLCEEVAGLTYEIAKDCPMYVLTNKKRSHGASVILYPNVLSDISRTIEDDCYLLPSSIHEIIMVPAKSVSDPDSLEGIIHQVNDTQVVHEELLSDHAYIYRSNEMKVSEVKAAA